jgi:hypothetical protein
VELPELLPLVEPLPLLVDEPPELPPPPDALVLDAPEELAPPVLDPPPLDEDPLPADPPLLPVELLPSSGPLASPQELWPSLQPAVSATTRGTLQTRTCAMIRSARKLQRHSSRAGTRPTIFPKSSPRAERLRKSDA